MLDMNMLFTSNAVCVLIEESEKVKYNLVASLVVRLVWEGSL